MPTDSMAPTFSTERVSSVAKFGIAKDILKLTSPSETYNYFNPMYQRNREPPKTYKGQYTTDLLWNKSRGFLDDARKSNQPFFLTMAPVSPHAGHEPRPDGVSQEGPIPDSKYKNFFNDAKVPRTKNFNPDTVIIPFSLISLKSTLCCLFLLYLLTHTNIDGNSRAEPIGSSTWTSKTRRL